MNEKHYKLRFISLFEDDLNSIVDYIALGLQNQTAADALVDDVQQAKALMQRAKALLQQAKALMQNAARFALMKKRCFPAP